MRVAESNRIQQSRPELRAQIQQHLDWLDAEVKAIEVQMQERVTKTPEWQVRDELLHSVKGVGVVTRLTLLAELPELGSMSGKQIAALVCIAPQVAL